MSAAQAQTLWNMVPTLDNQERIIGMQMGSAARIGFLNEIEIQTFLRNGVDRRIAAPPAQGIYTQVTAQDMSAMPTPRLFVDEDEFDCDFFQLSEYVISERLRDYLGLGPDVVQYLDIDCSGCSRTVQNMRYKIFNPMVFANPLDRHRTGPGYFADIITPDGPTFAWVREEFSPNDPWPTVAWRSDFVPPAPLFYVPGNMWMLVTETLADRITRAGFDDVAFLDVTNDGTRTEPLIFRNGSGLMA
jgi:hypothetical protein